MLRGEANGVLKRIRFRVVKGKQMPILSADTSIKLKIVTLHVVKTIKANDLLNEFEDVFDGDGRLCQTGN